MSEFARLPVGFVPAIGTNRYGVEQPDDVSFRDLDRSHGADDRENVNAQHRVRVD